MEISKAPLKVHNGTHTHVHILGHSTLNSIFIMFYDHRTICQRFSVTPNVLARAFVLSFIATWLVIALSQSLSLTLVTPEQQVHPTDFFNSRFASLNPG